MYYYVVYLQMTLFTIVNISSSCRDVETDDNKMLQMRHTTVTV